jgi:hypothetical protein
MPPKKRPTK